MIKKIIKYSPLLFILGPKIVSAENEWSLQLDWPSSPTGLTLDSGSTIAELVEYFFEWGILLGVILTFSILIYASFQYIVSSGDPQKMSKAKGMLSSSFLGLIILFGSWMLIIILNPELTVISDVSISTPSPDISENWDELRLREDSCDYGVISYIERGDSENKITMIDEGEVRRIQIEPSKAIACKSNTGFGNHLLDSGEVYFVKARTVSEESRRQPVCEIDCAQDIEESCGEEIMIEEDPNMSKYCYDHRLFERDVYNYPGAPNPTSVGSVKYVSQNPNSLETSCLAGDERLEDGGGCVVNLYETTHAARCGQKITDTGPVGDISQDYDKNINCIEVLRYPPPASERLNR